MSYRMGIHRMLACLGLLLAAAQAIVLPARSQDISASANQADRVQPNSAADLMQRYCWDCHGPDTQEAEIRLDTLDLAANDSRIAKTLNRMLRVVSAAKMPPEDAEAPTEDERALLVSWIEDRLHSLAESERRAGHGTRNRRLTIEEYNYTLQALFDVDATFSDLLPDDPISETGFRNDSRQLDISSLQIEAYLDSARRAIKRYVQFGNMEQQPLRYQIEFEDLFYATAERYKTRQRAPSPLDAETFEARKAANRAAEPRYVDPLGPRRAGAVSDDEAWRAAIPKLNQQYAAIPQRLATGELIVRIRAAGTADRDGRFPSMRVEAGITLGDGCSIDKRVLGEVDVSAPLHDPSTYEFRIRLEDVPTKGPLSEEDAFDRLSLFDMDQLFISNVSCDPKAIFELGRGAYSDPDTGSEKIARHLKQLVDDQVCLLHLDAVEIEMLPGVGVGNHSYRWQIPVNRARGDLANESEVARQFLERFMRAAFRRPVADDEVAAKFELFRALRQQDYTFQESLQDALAAVLISPSFLFLESSPPADEPVAQAPTPYQLAARLSYLLWLAPPDETLMRCAEDGSIVQASVLRNQTQRMLADPRNNRFLQSFCRQWLRLDKHANIAVDRQRYPSYDDDLSRVSILETLSYFEEVFRTDASALDLIDSDYAVLNDRLAELYDIDDVLTGELHRVSLPQHSVRGGLLTQASLLTMNSDGRDSHPIRRGVWLLDRLLNSPPPPPPPNVPEIDGEDPDFRGRSLKQQIERHRQPGPCQACHDQIDPWGLAFEHFDAIGRWRDEVEIREAGGFRSLPVDAATVLPDGQSIDSLAELKMYLREQRAEQFADALVHHMLTYANGRPPDFADRQQVNEIQHRFAASQYQLKELILAIVESEIFRH